MDYFAIAKGISRAQVEGIREQARATVAGRDKRLVVERSITDIRRAIRDLVMVLPEHGDASDEERWQFYRLRRALQDLEEGVRPVRETR